MLRHMQVMTFARELGLSQAAIARHLGLHHEQAHGWAKGRSPIPRKHQERLSALLLDTAHMALSTAKGRTQDDTPPLLGRVEQLIGQFCRFELAFNEHCVPCLMRKGLADLQAFTMIPRAALHTPANITRIQGQTATLWLLAKLNASLGPMPAEEGQTTGPQAGAVAAG